MGNYKHGKTMVNNYCEVCNKIINYRSVRCKKCAKKGKKNPNFKDRKLICIDCGKKLKYYGTKRCISCARKGKLHPNFKGWKSREPYGKEFSPELKEYIRKKYNYTCQECSKHQSELKRKLPVHHIDFDKKNNSEENLIPLCVRCHTKTNYNRKDWIKYFKEKVING